MRSTAPAVSSAPAGQQGGELLEQLGHQRRLGRRAGDRDLVAPDVDVGVE